jgi:hypothetical protein
MSAGNIKNHFMSAFAVNEKITTEAPKACRILILCEDFVAYERAVEVCRRIQARFGDEFEFDFNCWTFWELADTDCARLAADSARFADIIMVSLHNAVSSPVLEAWLNAFPGSRIRAEGALVLVRMEFADPEPARELSARLEQWATRLEMDFVPLISGVSKMFTQMNPWAGMEAAQEFPERRNYDHWGLNE